MKLNAKRTGSRLLALGALGGAASHLADTPAGAGARDGFYRARRARALTSAVATLARPHLRESLRRLTIATR
jgi:hypothetical protein